MAAFLCFLNITIIFTVGEEALIQELLQMCWFLSGAILACGDNIVEQGVKSQTLV